MRLTIRNFLKTFAFFLVATSFLAPLYVFFFTR